MKKICFPALAIAIIYFGCTKMNNQSSSTQTTIKTLIANAGVNSTICVPYGGTGNVFKGILDGTASHDASGKIIFYAWTEITDGFNYNVVSNQAKTEIILSAGVHQFQLMVWDDHNQTDKNSVVINVIQNFNFEYDGLSWDSTVGALTTISVKAKPALIESWPGPFESIQPDFAYISIYDGTCKDFSSWTELPYVPYDSIQLTDKPVFYSLIFNLPNSINHGNGYPEIYAKTNSGIDFNQKVSIGIIKFDPNGPGQWDY